MAGIYIHIPFCKQACHYCNFHFSTVLKQKSEILTAIQQEIKMRKDYVGGEKLKSVYFGGGTPSILEISEIEKLLQLIRSEYSLTSDCEITIEGNPDDLTKDKLEEYKYMGVNRLSIGIQSFLEDELVFMNRSHDVDQAFACLENAKASGFLNINMDLIFGSPLQSIADWEYNLQQFINFEIAHLSCYALTIEPKTVFHHRIAKKTMKPLDDKKQANQFLLARKMLLADGYEQYEISNYAKNKLYAIHNTNYWRGEKYLGVGPSAHSYNGMTRQWNISNNSMYIKAIHEGTTYFQIETLKPSDSYNEYVMTSLRTIWGCNVAVIEKIHAKYAKHFFEKIQAKLSEGLIIKKAEAYCLSETGMLFADGIAADLFVDDIEYD
ncbi:MAG: radical SAM family heme chaperone HemW [Melioribacteraceae bacterium]|nr:radical SAM family heme chaperone HemW [Melioribacteraceae bacterium]